MSKYSIAVVSRSITRKIDNSKKWISHLLCSVREVNSLHFCSVVARLCGKFIVLFFLLCIRSSKAAESAASVQVCLLILQGCAIELTKHTHNFYFYCCICTHFLEAVSNLPFAMNADQWIMNEAVQTSKTIYLFLCCIQN